MVRTIDFSWHVGGRAVVQLGELRGHIVLGFGMVAFESFTPIRLAELVDGRDASAALMVRSLPAAWAVSALGAAMVRSWSMVQVSVALRLVQGRR